MSECSRPVDALLVADLAELTGDADTDLGRHVRACPRCSARAREIVAANGRLDRTFGAEAVIDASALIARARSDPASPMGPFDLRNARWIPHWSHWVPVRAAGAAGALVVLTVALLVTIVARREPPSSVVPVPEGPVVPLVVDAPGYDVAVIPTANPDLTIIWFSKEKDDAKPMDAARDGPAGVGPGNGL